MGELSGLAQFIFDSIQKLVLGLDRKAGQVSSLLQEIRFNVRVLDEFTPRGDREIPHDVASVIVKALKHEIYDDYRRQGVNFRSYFSQKAGFDPDKPLYKCIDNFYQRIEVFQAIIDNIDLSGKKVRYKQRLLNLKVLGAHIIRQLDPPLAKKKK